MILPNKVLYLLNCIKHMGRICAVLVYALHAWPESFLQQWCSTFPTFLTQLSDENSLSAWDLSVFYKITGSKIK